MCRFPSAERCFPGKGPFFEAKRGALPSTNLPAPSMCEPSLFMLKFNLVRNAFTQMDWPTLTQRVMVAFGRSFSHSSSPVQPPLAGGKLFSSRRCSSMTALAGQTATTSSSQQSMSAEKVPSSLPSSQADSSTPCFAVWASEQRHNGGQCNGRRRRNERQCRQGVQHRRAR